MLICFSIWSLLAIGSNKLYQPSSDEFKNGQWLGVNVRSQGKGGKVMVRETDIRVCQIIMSSWFELSFFFWFAYYSGFALLRRAPGTGL